jgi:hypothetical protein
MRHGWIARLGLSAAGVVAFLAGCAAPGKPQLPICPGKADAEQALVTLAAHAEQAVPFRANGRAVLTYHVPDKTKPERHALPGIELRFDPPMEIYVQGSVAVDPRAVILGSNEKEFWLALRPKEMSSYYIGRWEDVRDFEGLTMSPQVVLEAVGILGEGGGAPDAALWTLQNSGPYDILTRRDQAGRRVKRIYIYACDYLVHKIEYFDPRGKVVAVAQFADYKPVTEGFRVPTRIRVVSTGSDGRQDSMDIDLGGLKTAEFSERQRQVLFNPPDPAKFEHIYRYEDGRWVAQ